jgi:polyribonucleotide nucleotidyltransferase
LFPDGFLNEVQIYCQPLSIDPSCDPDVLALTGASAALSISDVPWAGPIAGVRVVRVNGELIANPTVEQTSRAELEIVMAASRDAIVMVEGEANEIPEDEVLEALRFGHEAIIPLLDMQERLTKACGKEKMPFEPPQFNEELIADIIKRFSKKMDKASSVTEKKARYEAYSALKDEIRSHYEESMDEDEYSESYSDISRGFDKLKKKVVRDRVIKKGQRIDGRDLTTVRPINIDLGWLPRVHGSAIFTRGETQANVTITLGTEADEQKIEYMGETHYENFLFHYNFPAYSVGEVRPIRGPGRREIGHGNLAGRSFKHLLPDRDTFPYTVRVVSDITESNGSSSMASVCGGSLAMMQAGVPLREPIAGVAMGLIADDPDNVAILTDILGDEDHLGDMDFKVTGTRKGVCAIQMDIKIDGLSQETFEKALEQARQGRLHILDVMAESISKPAPELSTFAPRIVSIFINPDRIRTLIGPGGKTIKSIQEQFKVNVSIDESGKVSIASPDEDACQQAVDMIKSITRDVEPGEIYLGTVKSIQEFGAFVEILPGQEGLLHITQLHSDYIEQITDVLKEGDEVLVKVLEVDNSGKIRLSRKAAIEEEAAKALAAQPQNGVESDTPEINA